MQTMFSPFRSASLPPTQNRYATSQTATVTNQASLLRGNLQTDKVEISPHFSGKSKTTYMKQGTLKSNGKPCYWLYKNGKLQDDVGPFQRVPVLDGKPGETKMITIDIDEEIIPDPLTDAEKMPPPTKR